jgi:hypothetical protein
VSSAPPPPILDFVDAAASCETHGRPRRVDARPFDPHQDGPDGAAGRRTKDDLAGYRADDPYERVAAFAADYYVEYFRSNDARDERQAHHARSDAAPDAGAGAWSVRPWAHADKDATIAVDVGEIWIEAARDAEAVRPLSSR